MVAKERSGFLCRVSLRERNPYPLAHQRRRRTRSSIALIHIMAHVVPSRPLKGMRYGDTTEWEPAPKQATSRKSRCKLLEGPNRRDQPRRVFLRRYEGTKVEGTKVRRYRRYFFRICRNQKLFANRNTRKPTKSRTTT